jgi:hypothetical protein
MKELKLSVISKCKSNEIWITYINQRIS